MRRARRREVRQRGVRGAQPPAQKRNRWIWEGSQAFALPREWSPRAGKCGTTSNRFDVKRQTSNVRRQTSNVRRQTSNVRRQTSNVKRQTSDVKRQMHMQLTRHTHMCVSCLGYPGHTHIRGHYKYRGGSVYIGLQLACSWLAVGLQLACSSVYIGLQLACTWLAVGLQLACS